MRNVVSRAAIAALASAFVLACTFVEPLDDYTAGPAIDAAADAPRDAATDAGACAREEKLCDGVCQSALDETFGCHNATCAPCAFANATADGCDGSGNCRMGACISGFADCNGRSEDGCEVALVDDPRHCGACGTSCDGLAHATSACSAGACAIIGCADGYADCNTTASDGCEIDTQSDVLHCGACDTPCPNVGNTTLACVLGACEVGGCEPGYLDCDGVSATGCECGFTNAQVACAGSACAFSACSGAFADCNGNVASDGCETDTASDPNHCGACGTSCEGGACIAGRCQPVPIATAQGNPGELALDLDYAYWSNYGAGGANGSVVRIRKDGLNLTLIAGGADTTQNSAWGVATDDATSRVFWTTYSASSHVGSALKVGGSVTSLAVGGRLRGAALDANYVYFANYEQSTIVRFDVTAASPVAETVATNPYVARPSTIAFDDTSVYWVNEGTPSVSSAGTPSSLANTGSVVAVTKATIGTATPAFRTLITGQDKPRGLAVDDANVYWTNASVQPLAPNPPTGQVARIAKDGSAAQTRIVMATGLASPRELALCRGAGCASDANLYVTTYDGGTILQLAKNAPALSTPTTLASQQKSPIGIAVDAKYVFWVSYGTGGTADGAIVKLVKQP